MCVCILQADGDRPRHELGLRGGYLPNYLPINISLSIYICMYAYIYV